MATTFSGLMIAGNNVFASGTEAWLTRVERRKVFYPAVFCQPAILKLNANRRIINTVGAAPES